MSIKTKTALAFAAFALVCVGATAALLIDHERESLETAVVERQELLTVNRATMVRDQLDLALVELLRVASTVEDTLRQDDDPLSERRVLAQAYRVLVFSTASVQLYDRDGSCKWAEPDPEACHPIPSDDRAFGRTIREQAPSITFVPDADGTGLIHLMAPLVDEGGKTRKVLVGTIDLGSDQALIRPLLDELPEPGTIALVTEKGRPVYMTPPKALERMPLAETIGTSERGSARGSVRFPHDGEDHVVAWAPVGQDGLSLIFVWPWHALQDGGESLFRQLVWLLMGLGVAALAIGYVMARTLTRPILELADGVRNAEGNPVIDTTERTDEVGELHNSFSTLLKKLAQREEELRRDHERISELAESLEQRVEERTEQLRNAQEALVRAERLAAVGEAGAVLSHELRNSLNSISVGIDALAGGGLREQSARHAVHRDVRGEIHRLRALSDDLLAFSRDPQLRLQETDVRSLLRQSVTLVDDEAEAQGVFVELRLAGTLPPVELDPDRMQTVLLNLLKNGVDAARSGDPPRTVAIGARVAGDELHITVDDSGRGVSEEVGGRVFQPFVTTKHAGTGLGLALASRFVQAHGGTLAVANGELGGARFDLRVPVQPQGWREPRDDR